LDSRLRTGRRDRPGPWRAPAEPSIQQGFRPARGSRRCHRHIGLASHRARVDAAGGVLVFLATPRGTHVCVELPLKR
ncbi:hypothetical protein FVP47_04380, partial [Mycobacterium tuberculosis]|nr:hypothetical protein [Mycobacterium tuberculosis]